MEEACSWCLRSFENCSLLSFFSRRLVCRSAFVASFLALFSSFDSPRGRTITEVVTVSAISILNYGNKDTSPNVPERIFEGFASSESGGSSPFETDGNPVRGSRLILGTGFDRFAEITRGWFSRLLYEAANTCIRIFKQ